MIVMMMELSALYHARTDRLQDLRQAMHNKKAERTLQVLLWAQQLGFNIK